MPSQQLPEVAARIRGESEALDRVVHRVGFVWSNRARWDDDQAPLESVALNLHAFYSGVERIFELIARHVDNAPLVGEDWHRQLLNRMAQVIPSVRPAVIGTDDLGALDELRRFRHLIRNVYACNLLPERIAGPVEKLPALWRNLRRELAAFAEFLDDLGRAAG